MSEAERECGLTDAQEETRGDLMPYLTHVDGAGWWWIPNIENVKGLSGRGLPAYKEDGTPCAETDGRGRLTLWGVLGVADLAGNEEAGTLDPHILDGMRRCLGVSLAALALSGIAAGVESIYDLREPRAQNGEGARGE